MAVQPPTYSQYFREYQIVEWRSFYVHYEQHKQIVNRLYLKIKNGSMMLEQSHDSIELIQQRIRQDIVKVDDFFMIQLDLCVMMKENYDKHIDIESNINTNLSTLMELISKLFNLYEFVWHNYTAFTKLINQIDLIIKQMTLRSGHEDEKIDRLGSSTPETPKTPLTHGIASMVSNNKYNNLHNELRNMKMMKKHRNLRETLDVCLTQFYENQTITQTHYNKIQSIICQYNTNLAQAMSSNVLSKSISINPWFYQYKEYSKPCSNHTNTYHTKFTSIPSGEDLDYSEHESAVAAGAMAIRIHVDRPLRSVHVDRPITAQTDRSHENYSDLWPEFSETRIDCDDGTNRTTGQSTRTIRTRTKEHLKNLKIRTSIITPNANGLSPYTASINNSQEINTPRPVFMVSAPIPDTKQCKCTDGAKHYVVLAMSMIFYCGSVGIYPFIFKFMYMDRITNMTLFAVVSSCQWPVWFMLWIVVFMYRKCKTSRAKRDNMVSNRDNIPLSLVYSGSTGHHNHNHNHCEHTQCPLHPTVQSNISLFTVYRRLMNYCSRSTLCNKYGMRLIGWSALMDALQIIFELIALYKLDGIIYLCISPLLSFAFHLCILYPILGKDCCAQLLILIACCAIQMALSYWHGAHDMLWGTLSLIACHLLSAFKIYLVFNRGHMIETDVTSACNVEYFLSFSFLINLLCFGLIIGAMAILYQGEINIDYRHLFVVLPFQDYSILCCLFVLMFAKIGIQLMKYIVFNKENKNKMIFLLLNADHEAYYNGDLVTVSILDVVSITVWWVVFMVLLNEPMSIILVAAWINICFVIYISYKIMANSLFSHDTFSWLTFIHSSYTSLAPNNMDSILLTITYRFYANFKLYLYIAKSRPELPIYGNVIQTTPNNLNSTVQNGVDELNNINDSVELSGIPKIKEPSQTETIPTPVPTVDGNSNDDNCSTAL